MNRASFYKRIQRPEVFNRNNRRAKKFGVVNKQTKKNMLWTASSGWVEYDI